MKRAEHLLQARVSRRGLFKGVGAVGLGAALAQTGLAPARLGALNRAGAGGVASLGRGLFGVRTAAADGDSIQDILNITATVEMFGVTFLGAGIASAEAGNFNPPIPDEVIAILKAARAQEQFHLEFFQSLGGQALTDTFHIPDPALLTDPVKFFDAVQQEETREIAAQIAAFTTFTEMQRPDLVKVSFQYAAEEAEHRLLANYAKGARPANNYAFEPALYQSPSEIIDAFRELGFIDGDGPAATYPGPGEIDASNVIETTPGGVPVSCAAPGGMTDPRDSVPPMDGCQYFEQTGHNLCDPFLTYWNNNGGLDVFGYPLTEAFQERNFDTGQTYLTQYFERQRFEWHPENAGTVYETLLGRMGVEILVIQNRDWQTFPKASANAPHYFSETGHAIAPEFWEYWSSHGLDFGDAGMSFRESLLLFGYPISEPAMETNADGDNVLTQWFERAVFELHPGNADEYKVLLRRLGAEFLDARG